MEGRVERVVACLTQKRFLDEARRMGLRLTRFNRELFQFAVELLSECGVEPPSSVSDPVWKQAYSALILPERRVGGRGEEQGVEAGYMTPATAVYYALYELYGATASKVMYGVLEDLLVPALWGEAYGLRKHVYLLFLPISPDKMDLQMELLRLVLQREPCVCSVPFFPRLLCSLSKTLSRSMARACIKRVKSICSGFKCEVVGDG